MGADVADAAGGAGAFGVGAPSGLFLVGFFEGGGEPALRVFDDHFAEVAEGTGADEVARLFDHGVAGVVVGEDEDFFGLRDDFAEGERFFEAEGDGLVADDVEAGFEEEFCGREVLVVGRDDDDEVEAFAGGFAAFEPGHLGVAAVNAGRVEEEVGAGGGGAGGVGGEGAGDEFGLIVE